MVLIDKTHILTRHVSSLDWLKAEGNFSERGRAELIGIESKKDCALLCYSDTDFESTLAI
jgi:hypothetical protein